MRNTQIIISIILLICTLCYSQGDTLNYVDKDSLKQGYWIFYGVDLPHTNYPDSSKVSEGYYLDGMKHGIWVAYHKDGSVKLRGEFVRDRPKGSFVRGRNPYGTECETSENIVPDSISVRIHSSRWKNACCDTVISLTIKNQNEFMYLDSLTNLNSEYKTSSSLYCSHSLNIYITKFKDGKACIVRFSDCNFQSKSAKLARDVALQFFDYE